MQNSQSQEILLSNLARHLECCPAWHCAHIESAFSKSEYFFPPSKPKPPSLGPTIDMILKASILDLTSRYREN